MEQNMNHSTEKEITLVDLIRLFISKWKILVIVAVIGAILGAVFGGIFSYKTVTYKSTISFNLSPSDSTDSLLYNLQSESFAEKLLLEENGLPPKEECNAQDYDAAVLALDAFEAMRKEKAELRLEVNRIQLSAIQNEYDKLESAYLAAYDVWSTYMNVQDGSMRDEEKINASYAQMTEADAAWSAYKTEVYYPTVEKRIALQQQYNLASIELRELRIEAENAVEKVLAPWREDLEIRREIAAIMNSVTYEYESLNIPSTSVNSEEQALNKGYIKISIAVEKDEEFAQFLLERFKERTPGFVEKHIEEISGTTQAECKLISTFAEIESSTDSYLIPAIKAALIVMIAFVALTYIFFVIRLAMAANATEKKEELQEGPISTLLEEATEQEVENN